MDIPCPSIHQPLWRQNLGRVVRIDEQYFQVSEFHEPAVQVFGSVNDQPFGKLHPLNDPTGWGEPADEEFSNFVRELTNNGFRT